MTIFYQNHWSNIKNYWTNIRLVCTHLNAFFNLNPNMAIKIWILNFVRKSWKHFEKVEKKKWFVVFIWHPHKEGETSNWTVLQVCNPLKSINEVQILHTLGVRYGNTSLAYLNSLVIFFTHMNWHSKWETRKLLIRWCCK